MVKAREKKEKNKIDRDRKRKKEGEKGKERERLKERKRKKNRKKGEKKMFIEPCMRFGYCLQLGTWNTIISPLLEGYQGLHSWQGLLVLK